MFPESFFPSVYFTPVYWERSPGITPPYPTPISDLYSPVINITDQYSPAMNISGNAGG